MIIERNDISLLTDERILNSRNEENRHLRNPHPFLGCFEKVKLETTANILGISDLKATLSRDKSQHPPHREKHPENYESLGGIVEITGKIHLREGGTVPYECNIQTHDPIYIEKMRGIIWDGYLCVFKSIKLIHMKSLKYRMGGSYNPKVRIPIEAYWNDYCALSGYMVNAVKQIDESFILAD